MAGYYIPRDRNFKLESKANDEFLTDVYEGVKTVAGVPFYFPSMLIGGLDKGVEMATGVSPLKENYELGEKIQSGLFDIPLDNQGNARIASDSMLLNAVSNDLMDFINPIDILTLGVGKRFSPDLNTNTTVGYASNVVEGQYGERKGNKFTSKNVRGNPSELRERLSAGEPLNDVERNALKNYDEGVMLMRYLNKVNNKIQRSDVFTDKTKKITDKVTKKVALPKDVIDSAEKSREKAGAVQDRRAGINVFTKWLPEAAKTGVAAMFNPVDRAMIAQHGISRDSQFHVKESLDIASNEKNVQKRKVGLHRGVASLQHMANMAARVGDDVSTLAEPIQKLIKGSLVGEKYLPLNMESYLDADAKIERTKADGTSHKVDNETKRSLLTFATDQWKKAGNKIDFDGGWLMAYKEPDNVFSGRHMFDFRQLSYPSKVMRKFFKDNPDKKAFSSVAELKEALNSGGKPVRIIASDETGVYVTESFAGSAITEGGVNVVTKFNLDGTADSLMSDVYDYMESHVGKPIEIMSEYKLFSVSGFSTDLKTTSKESSNITNRSKKQGGLQEQDVKEALEKVTELRPDKKEILKQARFALPRAGIIATDLNTTVDIESQETENEKTPVKGMLGL